MGYSLIVGQLGKLHPKKVPFFTLELCDRAVKFSVLKVHRNRLKNEIVAINVT